ncbi:MAG: methyltransferase domain-containing protein [bacterium]
MSEYKRWQDHTGWVLDSVNDFDVIECGRCEFKHIIPIPAQEDLTQFYSHDYYSKEKPFYIERQKKDLDWWNLVYQDRYDTFEEHLPANRRRVLDVGAGPGYFLLYGKNHGWEPLGIEPSMQAVKHSQKLGVKIVQGFLTEQTAQQLGLFDVVHMSEVLEHIPHPTALLRITKSLLNQNGLLCVVVPNDYNPFQKSLRSTCRYKPWWVTPPHHINYFDFDSLCKLVTALGFEVVLTEATFPIDIFLLMGENYVGKDAIGRKCHEKRKAFERVLNDSGFNHIKRSLYRSFAQFGIGREIVLIARPCT